MDLSNLKPNKGAKHSSNFRRGRGESSGSGKTAGKGHKGQKARSGAPRLGFEGGQMPLFRRLPKRGFTNRNEKVYAVVNVAKLEQFDNGTEITADFLKEQGVIAKVNDGLKVLGGGELTKKLTVKATKISGTAKEKIEAAGGQAEVI